MAISHVQSTHTETGGATGNSLALAYGSNITAGALLLVAVSWDYGGGSFSSISDTLVSSWNLIGSEQDDASTSTAMRTYYAYNTGAGANTVTANFSAAVAFRALAIAEYSGAATATVPLDQTAIVTTGSTSTGTDGTATGNITPSVDGALVAALIQTTTSGPTCDAGTSYTERVDGLTAGAGGGFELEDFTQATAAAIPGRWTIGTAGVTYNARVVSFKPPTVLSATVAWLTA